MGHDWWPEVVNLFDGVVSESLHKLWILTEPTFVVVSAVCDSRNGAKRVEPVDLGIQRKKFDKSFMV
jgi:hypothetical protein